MMSAPARGGDHVLCTPGGGDAGDIVPTSTQASHPHRYRFGRVLLGDEARGSQGRYPVRHAICTRQRGVDSLFLREEAPATDDRYFYGPPFEQSGSIVFDGGDARALVDPATWRVLRVEPRGGGRTTWFRAAALTRMPIRIVRVGSPRTPDEGTRWGPLGVRPRRSQGRVRVAGLLRRLAPELAPARGGVVGALGAVDGRAMERMRVAIAGDAGARRAAPHRAPGGPLAAHEPFDRVLLRGCVALSPERCCARCSPRPVRRSRRRVRMLRSTHALRSPWMFDPLVGIALGLPILGIGGRIAMRVIAHATYAAPGLRSAAR